MSTEAILTVVSVALAILALVPAERAQDIQVRLGVGTRLLALVGAAVILYWAFLDQLHALPLLQRVPRSFRWVGTWTPASASLLVFLTATGIGASSYFRRLPVGRLPRLRDALSDALARRHLGECVHMVSAHFGTITRAHRGQYVGARLRERFAPTLSEVLAKNKATMSVARPHTDHAQSEASRLTIAFPSSPRYSKATMHLSELAEAPRDAAHDIVRMLSRAPTLTQEVARVHPYLGLDLLTLDSSWLMDAFATDYARALLGDPQSAAYRELRGTDNIDDRRWPQVDPREQPILARLCADALSTDGPRLAYTFLFAGIEPVQSVRKSVLHRTLSGPLDDYYDRGRWTSPPYFTVALLRLLAIRLASQKAVPNGFLNLYDAKTLAIALLRRLAPARSVHLAEEWPTPTHYLVYELVSLLSDTVLAEQPIFGVVSLASESLPLGAFREHAIDVLGALMETCLCAHNLEDRFKGYLLHVWWRAYARKYQGSWSGSARVLDSLALGGRGSGSIRIDRQQMSAALAYVDHVLKYDEPGEALMNRFGVAE